MIITSEQLFSFFAYYKKKTMRSKEVTKKFTQKYYGSKKAKGSKEDSEEDNQAQSYKEEGNEEEGSKAQEALICTQKQNDLWLQRSFCFYSGFDEARNFIWYTVAHVISRSVFW